MTYPWIVAGITSLYGLFIGSAINAFVWRLHEGRSWVKGRSMCPNCGHELAGRDLVPVLSWLWLRGKCRYCRAPIHWQYPVVEAITALLFGLSAWVLSPASLTGWINLIFWLVLLSLLIILAVYDARWMLLPDKVMYPAIGVAGLYLIYRIASTASLTAVRGPLLGAVLAGGIFYAIAAATKGKAMGGGDIKLAFLMGLLLGLKGTALALFIAFNSAAIVGLVLIATKLKRRRDMIPFGPYLIAGTITAFLFGHSIIGWYLSINGL
jgi:prepilin signal peptidase PulO-like enzyme (type II secretory pathway)